MSIEDIINGKQSGFYPVKEFTGGAVTTRIQMGPEYKVTRTINFAGREIPLPSLLDTFQQEKAVREPTTTVTLSPVGRLKAVRGTEEVKHGDV